MKIIEALKELPLLEKRIQKNNGMIAVYASDVDTGHGAERQSLAFSTVEEQRKEVQSLVQSTNDLVKRKAELRRKLAITNATVEVKIEGVTMTIAEWIEYRQHGVKNILNALSALNDNSGRQKMQSTQFDPEKGIKIIKFYDEKDRNEQAEKWSSIADKIDSSLEIVNATTDLIE